MPAGDIGVGGREIGFMYGQWKQITKQCAGVLTGKGRKWGGSHIRPEATGYGVVYITQMALADHGKSFEGQRVAVSGSGNVAEFTAEKVMELGGTVVSFSDSEGSIIEPDGFTDDQVKKIRDIKAKRGRCKEYTRYSKTAKLRLCCLNCCFVVFFSLTYFFLCFLSCVSFFFCLKNRENFLEIVAIEFFVCIWH